MNWRSISLRLKNFLSRHPLVKDALIWSVPALLFGLFLRALLLSYSPFAYWGADSNSYFGFSWQLLDTGKISLYDKRRYLYPIFLLPVTLLPGSTLRWIAWLQPVLGLVTIIPFAYCVRKIFVAWRWFIIPITVIYAGLPILIWYEHELLAENFFFASIVWMCAGWIAWTTQKSIPRIHQYWWWFFIPFALAILTKPAGRFLWPGVVVGIVLIGMWRFIKWKEAIALVSLAAIMTTIGQDSQAAWMLYTASFPLTRLDTPKHAEYKMEIRDLVEDSQKDLGSLEEIDRPWELFLESPGKQTERPLWQALGKNSKLRTQVYKDLALEGIVTQPHRFSWIAFKNIAASANLSTFKSARFDPSYFTTKYRHFYEEENAGKPEMLRKLFGLPKNKPLPPYSELEKRIAPQPESGAARWMKSYADGFAQLSGVVKESAHFGLSPLGWWVAAAFVIALAAPAYRRTVGICAIVAIGYLGGVFLVAGANARYFAAAWPAIILLLPVPIDALVRFWTWQKARAKSR